MSWRVWRGEHERDADAVLEMAVEQVLATEPRERAAGEVAEGHVGIERPGVVVAQVGHQAVAFSASSPRVIAGAPAKRPLSIARIDTS